MHCTATSTKFIALLDDIQESGVSFDDGLTRLRNTVEREWGMTLEVLPENEPLSDNPGFVATVNGISAFISKRYDDVDEFYYEA